MLRDFPLNVRKKLGEDVFQSLCKALDNPIRLQIFKTNICNEDIKEAIEIHKKEIITSIVYSKYSERMSALYNHPMYDMSGFQEQEGRLPKITDTIRVFRGQWYFDVIGEYILSELGFEVVRNNN